MVQFVSSVNSKGFIRKNPNAAKRLRISIWLITTRLSRIVYARFSMITAKRFPQLTNSLLTVILQSNIMIGIDVWISEHCLASKEAKNALRTAWVAVLENRNSADGLFSENTGIVGANLSAAMTRVSME